MKLHTKVLGPAQARVLKQLGPLMVEKGFYLAGGTAAALQLGHRSSVDFDWFIKENIGEPLRLAQQLRADGIPLQMGRIAPGTLQGTIHGVRVTFFAYRYPLIQPLIDVEKFKCKSASPADLAAMKLSAIAQRGAKKDFIDVYALVRRAAPLAQMLKWYQTKFQIKDVAHLLFSLSYFDDADRERTPSLYWKVDWRTIKRAIAGWITEIAGGISSR